MALVRLEVGKISNTEFRNHRVVSGVLFTEPARPAKSYNEYAHDS